MEDNILVKEGGRLRGEARRLFFDDVLDGLLKWYRYALDPQWRYVVFAVRRSYILALIMERITGESMESCSKAKFLTDGAFFLHCQDLAEIYRRTGRFPRTLVCDDVIIHGRNINHILTGIEQELCRILGDDYEEDRIRDAFAKAVTIHVYASSKLLLLLGRYEWRLHFIRRDEPVFWRQLGSDIASLITRSNIVNASYIYTEYLSDEDMARVNLDGYVSTVYQNIRQYTKCRYAFVGNDVKAVATLRIIKNVNTDGYRAAPFLFLPNLDTPEHREISYEVLTRIPDRDIRDWLWQLEEVEGKRTFNEVLSLLFSNAILREFNRENGIRADEADKELELNKLARNYNQHGFYHAKGVLEKLLSFDLFSVSEMMRLFVQELPEERIVMRISRDEEILITESVKKRIRKRIEDYFYQKGYVDEESAYELTQQPYFRTRRRTKRRARGCCFTLTELNEGYTQRESVYCMAYFLQMVDIGVAGISSYAPNDVRVVGYAQFTKAGEQSLLIEPLRQYKYLSMLGRLHWECERHRKPMEAEIREYCRAYPELYSEECEDTLVDFVEKLEAVGQTPEDWGGIFIDRVDEEAPGIYGDIIDERRYYYEHYKQYAEEKNRF
ncbi:MAG: hypothetical protein NC419_12160 [Muribaculaceae bacterium]|nr:hypothetical protein [Muribaculaceae bacterium]